MTGWRDRFNQVTGRTRFAVCRLFLHLAGEEVAPLLGVLNRAARQAIDMAAGAEETSATLADSEGDIEALGLGLVEICQSLLQYDTYWLSAANEGDVFWNEGEAGDYFNELFTDSAQRYLSEPDLSTPISAGVFGANPSSRNTLSAKDEPLSLPITRNLIVMITVAYEGEVPELETNLADISPLKAGLKALINLHYQEKLRAIQVHFSPAQLGDELTDDQMLQYFPELVPL